MKKSSNAKTVAGKKLKTLEHFLTVLAQTMTKPLLIYFSVKKYRIIFAFRYNFRFRSVRGPEKWFQMFGRDSRKTKKTFLPA